MKNVARKGVYALMLALMTSSAQAGALYCNGGTVAQLSYHGRGTVYLRMSNMNTAVGICSFDAEWGPAGSLTGTTSAATCKALYGALLAHKLSATPVKEVLFDGDAVPANCTSFAGWAAVNLRYLDL